jgi:hypothetical protein
LHIIIAVCAVIGEYKKDILDQQKSVIVEIIRGSFLMFERQAGGPHMSHTYVSGLGDLIGGNG